MRDLLSKLKSVGGVVSVLAMVAFLFFVISQGQKIDSISTKSGDNEFKIEFTEELPLQGVSFVRRIGDDLQFGSLGEPKPSNYIHAKNKFLHPDSTYYYYIDEGPPNQQEQVRFSFENMKNYCGVKLYETNERSKAIFRVGFVQGNGTWSYIGSDCKLIPIESNTMNMGWDEPDIYVHKDNQEAQHLIEILGHGFNYGNPIQGDTVRFGSRPFNHEGGHGVLNLAHAHFGYVNYDTAKLYKDFWEQHGWTKEMVDRNLIAFEKDQYEIVGDYNPKALMGYWIDCNYTIDNQNCGNYNTFWSLEELERMQEMFGPPTNGETAPIEPCPPTPPTPPIVPCPECPTCPPVRVCNDNYLQIAEEAYRLSEGVKDLGDKAFNIYQERRDKERERLQ